MSKYSPRSCRKKVHETMKISLRLLLITCTATIFSVTPAKSHQLSAVSPLIGLEQYYVYIRKKRLGGLTRYASYPSEEPITVKENICSAILESVLFDSYQLEPANQNLEMKYPKVYEEAKQKYPNIYENLYDRRKPSKKAKTSTPYQIYNITTSKKGMYKEYLFACSARNRRSREIIELFVSRKYDVNEYSRVRSNRIEGRFVFMHNEQKKISLVALAEEAAHQSFDRKSIEGIYLEAINKRVRNSAHKVDPICELSKARKVRLCTIVLNAAGCQGNVRFLPDESNVEPECERHQITFQYKKQTQSFREWMVGCKAQTFATREPVTYYVSRGYTANTCYVYKMEDGKMVFDHLSSNVGIYVLPRTYMDPA